MRRPRCDRRGIVFGGDRGLYWRLPGRENPAYWAALYKAASKRCAEVPSRGVAMCSRCVGFAEKIRIQTPGQYFDLVREVKEVLAQGTLALIDGNVDLAEISPGKGWPDDYIEHTFQCSQCGQRFRLFVETYHGSGGHWQPFEEAPPTD